MKSWPFWLAVLVLGGGGWFAWKKFKGDRQARIERMSIYAPGDNMGAIRVDFDLKFQEAPANCDATDARIELASELLTEPLDYDWEFLAAHVTFREKPATPPVGESFQVRIPLQQYLKPRVKDLNISDFALRGKLYWCGRQQDSDSYNLRVLYEKEK